MMKFSYYNPTRIQFGANTIASIATLIPKESKVLVTYGGGSIKKNGIYDQVKDALKDYEWHEFSGIEPNPLVETLDKAVAVAKEKKIDFILAVGGGSVIDGSKYIAAAALYDGEGWDILEKKHIVTKALPLGAILTLPATASESNPTAVISRKSTQTKLAFSSSAVYPKFAVLDPSAMVTLPERQIANGLVDSFIHTCEQYLTYPVGALVQDGYCETLLRTLKHLIERFNEHDDLLWQENLMWAANQGLSGLIGVGVPQDWATHRIGHELTAMFGIDHARTLTIVQPALLREMISDKAAKLSQMGRNVFHLPQTSDIAEKTIDAIEALYRSIGMPVRFSDCEITDPETPAKLVAALKEHNMIALGEKGNITPEISEKILTKAMR
ncbi:iron-containing alcohol dehydrogenase [Microvirga sp. W0021]|uniref:Iron-containing alcohol dehydrogenase n=1 Tax=Hohaiivirga grylli TaxID=3133970 RepID=A0ABV0BHG8_9HYPH